MSQFASNSIVATSLFRAIMELREIVLAAYRGRNEVLRSSFSPEAHDALSRGLEALESSASPTKPIEPAKSKEDQLRTFLTHDWVRGFHDVHVANSNDCVLVIPDAIGYSMGKEALQTLTSESIKDRDQFISYDNSETFQMKVDYASKKCLG